MNGDAREYQNHREPVENGARPERRKHADRKGDQKPGDGAADDERGGDRCSVHDHAADFDAPAVGAAERSVGEVPDVLAVFLDDASVDADRRTDVAGAELVPGHEA